MNYKKWLKEMTDKAFKDAKYIQLDKGQVHYTDIGKSDDEVILHVHGSPAGADIGPLFLRDFVEDGYRVLTPSRPGFLGTALDMGAAIEEQADLLKAFLDKMGIAKVYIHAWSAGGPPAIAFIIKYPEMVKGYIHYCAVGHRWDHKITRFEKMMMSNRPMWLMHNLSKVFKKSFRKTIADQLGVDYNYVMKDEKRTQLMDAFFEMTAPPSLRNDGSFNDIRNYSEMSDPHYEKVIVPTLVIFCQTDKQLPYSNGVKPAEEIKDAIFLQLESGGHMPMIDKDAELCHMSMMKFIEQKVK